MASLKPFSSPETFNERHIGPTAEEQAKMLETLGYESLDALTSTVVPESIQFDRDLDLPSSLTEREAIARAKEVAGKNEVFRSLIGMGYYGTHTPYVILRNILENPGWYTQYTPYQAEIAQGRLEALFNFQTLVTELTGLPVANASLLDEGTAAAEAMGMVARLDRKNRRRFLALGEVHPQTISVMQTRAEPLGLEVVTGSFEEISFNGETDLGILIQYPSSLGGISSHADLAKEVRDAGGKVVVAADPMALVLLDAPGNWGADIVVGSMQRFGVPMGFGGPHAAYMAASDGFKRQMPGRIVGQSIDAEGNPALRLALQTREQHIRRDKATSNICTAQVLLAVMASMYAVYHGPKGLRRIATRIHEHAVALSNVLVSLGYELQHQSYFDTVAVKVSESEKAAIEGELSKSRINLRVDLDGYLAVSVDELSTSEELEILLNSFAAAKGTSFNGELSISGIETTFGGLQRQGDILTQEAFNSHHSETELLRYMAQLQAKDVSLATSMIPLGSCTMKLNATAEMIPVTWPEFCDLHPFAPKDQTRGYLQMFQELEDAIAEITGLPAVSLQPNAGSQGEYAGMLAIRGYHLANGDTDRTICLIPQSAHGTNPASAIMAGMKVVVVKCDDDGNVDVSDLKEKSKEHADHLAAVMVTYPSTHGVFENEIREICDVVHSAGGQVYLDGANLNAQVGLCRPGDYGADVIHLNLHKTFCIPHGGGGPGMGPIAAGEHLRPFLPNHPVVPLAGECKDTVSAAPWGSAAILPISWMYIQMLGGEGLKLATQVAILNANYMAKKLEPHFDVLYRGNKGLVAHEFIIDLRPFKATSGVEVEDVAKRLMDYGFHAPTVSWPVAGTIMIEPTESEPLQELDRFCDALIGIRSEIDKIADGTWDQGNNPLKNAPHTAHALVSPEWNHTYTREEAVFPTPWIKAHKFWPPVARINNVAGDRNLVCSCPPLSDYSEA